MRTLLISVAALALAGVGQASAQEHEGHPAKPPTAAGSSMPPMGPMASGSAMPVHDGAMMPTHEMCQSAMGREMDPKQLHNHSADKGAPMAGMTKPLTREEMAAMHTKCAAMMKADQAKN